MARPPYAVSCECRPACSFNEAYDGKDDLTRFVIARSRDGSISALREFETREAEQGTRFHYASSETVLLAVLLREVTGTTLSQYLTTRLWQPMGAEADATWSTDRRHRNRVRKFQCDPARLRASGNAAGQ